MAVRGDFDTERADELTDRSNLPRVGTLKVRRDCFVDIRFEGLKIGSFSMTPGKFDHFPNEPTGFQVLFDRDGVCMLQRTSPLSWIIG